MVQKTKRPKYGSMDGFIRPSQPSRPRQRLSSLPVDTAPHFNNQHSTKPEASLPLPQQPVFPTYYSPYATQSAQPTSRTQKQKSKWSRKRKFATSALTILLVGFGLGGWYGAGLLGSINKVFHGNIITDVHALVSHTTLKGEDQGRVNILLAGDSADDPHHGGAQLTDSIMLVSIDTKNHTGFMLSIPRDLWVNIPGVAHQKINAANEATNFNQSGYPKGGMGQLEQIVQTDLGVPVNYYALINYAAFKDAINAIGGVSITIQSPDPRGLYDPNIAKVDHGPLKLPNGVLTLDGQTALNLARARGDPCFCGHVEYGFPQSDFNRTQHQRQMLTALIQKGQSAGVFANPIKVSQLFSSFGNNIATDLSLQDVARFTEITKGINVSKLQPLSLSNSGQKSLLKGYTAPDGEEALIPAAGVDDFGQIRQFYQQLTSNDPVVKEAPSVVVLNATGINGLAHKQAALLQAKGFNVIGAADANGLYQHSLIVDGSNNQKPASTKLLQTVFPRDTGVATGTTSSLEAGEAKSYKADFVVLIGQDSRSTQKP